MSHANWNKSKVFVKRAYEDATPEDGYRVLVDRIWPRGRSKEVLALDQWERDLAPSVGLRKWFGHDAKRWDVFQQRYRNELDTEQMRDRVRHLLAEADGRKITLVYGAKDEEHNQAIVLQDVLSHWSGE
ncbi:uroporphyrin-III C-methyltransferase [Paraburkholderia hospita]|uniref:Uroporphyrin-III C-methyltransferase n=1 Tax=Paraburkholderia hospita TaxID=169430 RepID=A0ABN0F5B2_9BURK|nr:DUF488 family protein [Paraburkholderia hospita]EIM93799.1 uroporphyrin-III C-methyltransferase [Paraburkholderia hospita]OUL80648.1 hypothetical protein CA602_27140 [Paraburkholderia hospita]OUL96362.1 hypothetical protein CA601_02655 [Paraburkholderia hospita]